jgi:O-antigen/teichoic acid export membrane protein
MDLTVKRPVTPFFASKKFWGMGADFMPEASEQRPKYSIAARSASGSVLLLARQVLCQGMNFCGIIFLARYLSIADYGFYGIVFFLSAFISNFGDIGLSASLLRQKEEPARADYASVFSAQLTLSAAAAAVFAALSPLLCRAYGLPLSYSQYLILVAASLLVTAFRSVPTTKLERHLDFKWLAVIEIAHTAVYNVMAAAMACYGYGPLSFTLALLCRVVLGGVLVNIAGRVPPQLNFNLALIKKHLVFGLPYQAGSFVNVFKDAIGAIVIGLVVGTASVGTISMASTIAAFPIMLTGILARLFFPAFARAASDKPALEKIFALSMRVNNALVAPLALFILFMAEPFTLHIFGEKWTASETMELWFLLWPANLFLPTLTVCVCLLNAFGLSKTVLKYNVLWMLINLGLGTPLVFMFGAKGAGYANIVLNVATIIVAWEVRKHINCNILKEALIGWFPAVLLAWFPLAYRRFFDIGKLHLFLCAIFYFAFSVAVMYIFSRKDIRLFVMKPIKIQPAGADPSADKETG